MIHILTLSWNGLDKLCALKDNLFNNLKKTGQEFCWYIRDNGSTDGTVFETCNWSYTNTSAIKHNRASFSKGVNDLFYLINNIKKDDFVLLLNNDIIFKDDNSILNMIKCFEKYPNVGIVGARLEYPNSDILAHAGIVFSKNFGELPINFKDKQKCTFEDKFNRYFQCVTGACLLTKAHIYEKVSGLDEKYFWMYEDVDFCLKVKYDLKFDVVYCGITNISHTVSATLNKNKYNRLMLSQNVAYFKQKWYNKYKIDYDSYNNVKNYMVI